MIFRMRIRIRVVHADDRIASQSKAKMNIQLPLWASILMSSGRPLSTLHTGRPRGADSSIRRGRYPESTEKIRPEQFRFGEPFSALSRLPSSLQHCVGRTESGTKCSRSVFRVCWYST